MIEVFGQDSILDENFLASVDTFVVHRISPITSHHGWVVNHGYDVVSNFLTKFSNQARITSSDQIGLAGVSKSFVNVNASQVFVGDEREFPRRCTLSLE